MGNSRGIRIPKHFIDKAKLSNEVEIVIQRCRVKVGKKNFALERNTGMIICWIVLALSDPGAGESKECRRESALFLLLTYSYSFSPLTFIQAFFMFRASSSMMGLSHRMRPAQPKSRSAWNSKFSFRSDLSTAR